MLQELLPGLNASNAHKDELKFCHLQWMYCYMMLLTGNSSRSRSQRIILVSTFLAHVNKVNAMLSASAILELSIWLKMVTHSLVIRSPVIARLAQGSMHKEHI
jgi:hypothetical protein